MLTSKSLLMGLLGVLIVKEETIAEAKEETIKLERLWRRVQRIHSEEETRKLEERKVTAKCQCATCVAEREEERRRREEEEERIRRQQDEDNDGFATDGYSDYD